MRRGRSARRGPERLASCPYPADRCSHPSPHPEEISGEIYDESSDVWSLGVTLYYCAMNQLPFVDSSGDGVEGDSS